MLHIAIPKAARKSRMASYNSLPLLDDESRHVLKFEAVDQMRAVKRISLTAQVAQLEYMKHLIISCFPC